MGQAKQKRAAQAAQIEQLRGVDVARVAAAVRKLAQAASTQQGVDCLALTWIARELLARLGVEAELAVGAAAWRVGGGDGDVISHTPAATPLGEGVPYHTWLEVAGHLLDVTTYQLPLKGAALDALDGGTTRVDWAPAYLFEPLERVSTYKDVAMLHAGLFHYQKVPGLKQAILARFSPDPEDAEAAWRIYQHPEAVVLGPVNLPSRP